MAPKRKLDGSMPGSLSQLFSRMTLAASSSDFARVLELANEALATSPTNLRAAKQKVVALIKLDRYKDALAFLDESAFLEPKDIALERGFCLYKMGKGHEAQRALEHGSGRAVQHVIAQNVLSVLNVHSQMLGVSNGRI